LDANSRHALVRERITAGLLTATPCGEVWGGKGTGSKCAGCENVIVVPEYEFECHGDGGPVFTVCRPCLYIWDSLTRETERMVG